MQKLHRSLLAIIAIFLIGASSAYAECVKIQSGNLSDVPGNQIKLGYDKYGYNYQAHQFNGLYDNFSRPATPAESGGINLIMKWSDDWLANQDCNGDGKLDRGLNSKTAVPTGESMGWLTNHVEGDCLTTSGDSIHVTYFVKIVWVGPPPVGDDPWSTKRIWGVYAIIEEVGEDASGGVCLGQKGLNRNALVNPAGFGAYK